MLKNLTDNAMSSARSRGSSMVNKKVKKMKSIPSQDSMKTTAKKQTAKKIPNQRKKKSAEELNNSTSFLT